MTTMKRIIRSLRDKTIHSLKAKEFEMAPEVPSSDDLLSKLIENNLYAAIIRTSHFQRLFGISFLGGLSYLDDKGKDNTRGHHSIGAALLAYYYCRLSKADKKTERLLVISGLLHDIHHLPFSHTMERAIKSESPDFSFGYQTQRIIFSRKEVNKESICDILGEAGVDWQSLPILKTKTKRAPILSSTHNVDTLDGITRAYNILFEPNAKVNHLASHVVRVQANRGFLHSRKSIQLLDAFWELKNKVYTEGIYQAKKVLLERILGYYLFDLCREFCRPEELINYTDYDLLERFPGLKERIKALWDLIESHCAISSGDGEYSMQVSCPVEKRVSDANKKTFEFEISTRSFGINKDVSLTETPTSWKKRYYVVPNQIKLMISSDVIKHIEEILGYSVLKQRMNRIFLQTQPMSANR